MINYISSFTVYFIEMLIAYIFFLKIADRQLSAFKCWAVGTALFTCGALCNIFLSNNLLINTFSFLAINFAFAFICFNIRSYKALFLSVILTAFSMALEFATIFVISGLFGAQIDAYNDQPMLLIIEGIISKLLYFITCLLLLNFIEKEKSSSRFPLSFYAYPLIAMLALFSFWYVCLQSETSDEIQTLLAIVSLLLFAATVMLFITYQHNIEKENQYILLKSEFNRLEAEKVYYDILEHQNQQLMIYAHDAKNHLSTIKSLNENPVVDDYITKMTKNLTKYTQISQSGNMTLDVILNRYKTESELKGIKFTFDVRLCNLSFVDDFDLVTILGNLLDNALEAAEKSEAKVISLETDYRNAYKLIIISNSCDVAPTSVNDRLITTKKDKSIHGLGLKSVLSKVREYEGDIDWEYLEDEKLFVTTVMMKGA